MRGLGMWLRTSRPELTRLLLDFLWRQWRQLGLGELSANRLDSWIIDPEALLLFSFEVARADPTLYDLILGWVRRHERLVNVNRLTRLLGEDDGYDGSLVGPVARWLARGQASAKWRRLEGNPRRVQRPFFLSGQTGRLATLDGRDPDFEACGWERPPVRVDREPLPLELFRSSGLVLRLRHLFGVNGRADLVAYLLACADGASPSAMSGALGTSQPAASQLCRDMERSGLLLMRPKGRSRIYRLDERRWRDFLGLPDRPLTWIGWPLLFRALAKVFRFIVRKGAEDRSDEELAGELRRVVKDFHPLVGASGLRVPLSNMDAVPEGGAITAFARDMITIFREGLGTEPAVGAR